MKDIRIDNGQLVFPRRMSKDEQAMVRVITPYIQWAIDNGMTSISLGDERRRLEKQRYILRAAHRREQTAKSDKESMYGYYSDLLLELYMLYKKSIEIILIIV